MSEIVNNYIGTLCLIYTMNDQLSGVIQAVNGNWITVDNGRDVEAVNLDYVIRIREHPKNKSDRKKAARD